MKPLNRRHEMKAYLLVEQIYLDDLTPIAIYSDKSKADKWIENAPKVKGVWDSEPVSADHYYYTMEFELDEDPLDPLCGKEAWRE
jgi:hypothetical protein